MVGAEALTIRRSRTPPLVVFGLVLGFAAILALVGSDLQGPSTGGHRFLAGCAALQLASLSWVAGSIHSRTTPAGSNPLWSAGCQALSGSLILLVAGSVAGEWQRLTLGVRSATALCYLILIGSVAGYTAYLRALRTLPIAIVSMYGYVNPIIAMALGTVVLAEPLGTKRVIAAGLVLFGVAIVTHRGRQSTFRRDRATGAAARRSGLSWRRGAQGRKTPAARHPPVVSRRRRR